MVSGCESPEGSGVLVINVGFRVPLKGSIGVPFKGVYWPRSPP